MSVARGRAAWSRSGFPKSPKELSAEIMDVADYLMGVDMQLEEFFLVEDPVM